jgi:hypothetical protein
MKKHIARIIEESTASTKRKQATAELLTSSYWDATKAGIEAILESDGSKVENLAKMAGYTKETASNINIPMMAVNRAALRVWTVLGANSVVADPNSDPTHVVRAKKVIKKYNAMKPMFPTGETTAVANIKQEHAIRETIRKRIVKLLKENK